MGRLLLAIAGVLAAAGLVLAPSVPAGGKTNCTTSQGGVTISGDLTAGPGCVLNGTTVTGNVKVDKNGTLSTDGATIGGNVEISNTSGTNSICHTSIGGNLQVHNNTGSNSIGGCGNPPNSVGGNVEVHNNSGQATVADAAVGHDLSIHNNSTMPGIDVMNASVGHDLDCHNDTPAASAGSGTVVDGKVKGDECTTSLTVDCPANGCDAFTSNDDTSAYVDVPGGGKKGKLTITLTPPPTEDGCILEEGEGDPTPIGSVVTVVPPGGYTADNPITVDIGFPTEYVQAVCKSDNGNPPFTPLDYCDYGESESYTPANVPCWEYTEGGVRVYITSNDPAMTGH